MGACPCATCRRPLRTTCAAPGGRPGRRASRLRWRTPSGARPTGGSSSRRPPSSGPDRTLLRTVAGREVVLWRDSDGSLLAGRGACPHLGARLADCLVVEGTVLCRWHGMQLGRDTATPWATYAAFDDGVLLWVRIGEVEEGVGADRPPGARGPPTGRGVARVGHLPARPTASPGTSSRTGSTPGTGPGCTPTPSATSPSTTTPRATTASSSTSPTGWAAPSPCPCAPSSPARTRTRSS